MRSRMKFVVPLTMPRTRRTRSPAKDSRNGRRMGMAPATAASKYRSRPAFSAASKSVGPSSASSALLAVTTLAPASSAASTRLRAGSIPPTTSTTTSTPEVTKPMASVVISSRGTSTSRGASGRRTATPTSSSEAPTRAARSSACSSSSRTTWLPTEPQPSRATRNERAVVVLIGAASATGSSSYTSTRIRCQKIVLGLPAQQDRGRTVAHRHDRRAEEMVVVAGHRAAVSTGAGDRDQVAGCHVAGKELVLDDDVAGLAVLPDETRQHRRSIRDPRGDCRRVVGVVESSADFVTHPAVDRDVGADRPGIEVDALHGADLVERADRGTDDRASRLHGEPRDVDGERTALVLDDLRELRGQLLGVGGVVLRGVGDPEAAAEVELAQLHTQLLRDPRVQGQHPT